MRCGACRASTFPAHLVAHGEPDGAGRLTPRRLGFGCEPRPGAGRRGSAEQSVRWLGVWDRVPQAAIERVEVVRGAASDLYGADALSGVVQVLTWRSLAPSMNATVEASTHETPRASVYAGTAGHGWTASAAGEASRTDGTCIAPEDRGAVDVRAGSDYVSGLATVGIERPAGWSLRVRGDGLGESRQNGTPLQTNSTDVRQGRFDVAAPLGGGQFEAYGQIGDQVYRQAFWRSPRHAQPKS